MYIGILFCQECKIHCYAYSSTRLRREPPLGGSLSNLCEHSTYNHKSANLIIFNRKRKIRENPRRGFSLFICVANKFTLSCVFRTIKGFAICGWRQGLRALDLRKLLKKLDQNLPLECSANIAHLNVELALKTP